MSCTKITSITFDKNKTKWKYRGGCNNVVPFSTSQSDWIDFNMHKFFRPFVSRCFQFKSRVYEKGLIISAITDNLRTKFENKFDISLYDFQNYYNTDIDELENIAISYREKGFDKWSSNIYYIINNYGKLHIYYNDLLLKARNELFSQLDTPTNKNSILKFSCGRYALKFKKNGADITFTPERALKMTYLRAKKEQERFTNSIIITL